MPFSCKSTLRFVLLYLPSIIYSSSVMAELTLFGPLDDALRSRLSAQLHLSTATETDFGQTLLFINERSPERTRTYALGISKPFSSSLFGWPVEISWNVGFQRFDERGLQNDLYGVSLFTKMTKQFRVPWIGLPLRAGFGQGFSYVNGIPAVEARDFAPSQSERFLVYLEYTLQVSASMLSGSTDPFSHSIQDIHFGYTVIHRSSAYGLLAASGGGINYIGLGLEVELR